MFLFDISRVCAGRRRLAATRRGALRFASRLTVFAERAFDFLEQRLRDGPHRQALPNLNRDSIFRNQYGARRAFGQMCLNALATLGAEFAADKITHELVKGAASHGNAAGPPK